MSSTRVGDAVLRPRRRLLAGLGGSLPSGVVVLTAVAGGFLGRRYQPHLDVQAPGGRDESMHLANAYSRPAMLFSRTLYANQLAVETGRWILGQGVVIVAGRHDRRDRTRVGQSLGAANGKW